MLIVLGDEEMVDWILESFPSVVEVSNANGDLCVHFAASQGFRINNVSVSI